MSGLWRDERGITRREFLRLGGGWIAGATLLGSAAFERPARAEARRSLAQGSSHAGKVLYASTPSDPVPGAMYPRVIRLEHNGKANGTLLATFEYYHSFDKANAERPYFQVYRSTDGGQSWAPFSQIHDTVHGWGMRYQPTLFELPQQVGPWPAGTILAAGNSIPEDYSQTSIDVYRSTDQGRSWSYVSTVVQGGEAQPGKDPVWEPDFQIDAYGNLVCYFSDERHKDQGYNQLLGHKVSTDGGQSWGDEVYDVAVPDGQQRPGMATVIRLPDGRYMMSYEIVGPTYNGEVHVKTSPDGDDWEPASEVGSPVQTSDGRQLTNGPYIVWTPAGGSSGTVIASAKTLRESDGTAEAPGSGKVLLANSNLGNGPWEAIGAPLWFKTEVQTGDWCAGWTTPLVVYPNGQQILEMTSTPSSYNDRCDIRYAIGSLKLAGKAR